MPAQPSTNVTYKTVETAAPAANTEQTITVPTTTKGWYVTSVFTTIVQGATQTPQPILQIKNVAGNVLFESFGSSAAQAVSTTCAYAWSENLALTAQIGVTTGVHSTAPLPGNLILPPGFVIVTSTLGIGANTQYGILRLMVAEYS